MVGAILTQNTAWTNVEKAIASLKKAQCLDARDIAGLELDRLAEMIRSSGYFNIKARRLKAFCEWLLANGGESAIEQYATGDLRQALLEVHGIGPETADDMVLYAFNRPVFVIDAYTRRIFFRLGLITGDEGYETLRAMFESKLEADVDLYNEFIVMHGKDICRVKPACDQCSLANQCRYMSEC